MATKSKVSVKARKTPVKKVATRKRAVRSQGGAATTRAPAAWLLEALIGGHSASSGVQVSESTALSLSPYYCGVNMISSTVASLPLNVYKRTRDPINGDQREIAFNHPAQYLLSTEPNEEMTSASFRQALMINALGRGNAYAEIQRLSDGATPYALWPIMSDRVRPVRSQETNKLFYQVRLDSGEFRYVPREDMIHVPGMSTDGIIGLGLISVAYEAIGLSAAQDQYAGKFFKNGGNVSMTLETDRVLKQESWDRLQQEIIDKFMGLTNAHRVALLEAGIKANPLNPTHVEAQLIETRRFSVEEWARWLNIPPHKLKELSHATFSNIEEQNIEYVVDTVRPWLVKFEQEYNRKLFRNYNQFYTKHNVDGLLRGNILARYQAFAIARNWGWYSPNDILEIEDRNPLPPGIGDVYLIPANMKIAGEADVDPEEDPADASNPEEPAQGDQPVAPGTQPGDQGTGQQQTSATRTVKAAAARILRYERKKLSSRVDRRSVYTQGFSKNVSEWLGITVKQAEAYSKVAQQLNLMAAEKNLSAAELEMAKGSALISLATVGEIVT